MPYPVNTGVSPGVVATTSLKGGPPDILAVKPADAGFNKDVDETTCPCTRCLARSRQCTRLETSCTTLHIAFVGRGFHAVADLSRCYFMYNVIQCSSSSPCCPFFMACAVVFTYFCNFMYNSMSWCFRYVLTVLTITNGRSRASQVSLCGFCTGVLHWSHWCLCGMFRYLRKSRDNRCLAVSRLCPTQQTLPGSVRAVSPCH